MVFVLTRLRGSENPETHSERSQISKMELLVSLVIDLTH